MKALLLLLPCLVGCNDPVREQAIADLGGERAGVPRGPLHRPGQPCLVCHADEGPSDSAFALAGTLYQTPDGKKPLHDARVTFTDSAGKTYSVVSNCAGNFWVGATNYHPAWPIWIKVELGSRSAEMSTPAFREGSCAGCHAAEATPSAVGPVYLADEGAGFSQEPCR